MVLLWGGLIVAEVKIYYQILHILKAELCSAWCSLINGDQLAVCLTSSPTMQLIQ